MNVRGIACVMVLTLLAGCASGLKQEVAQLEYQHQVSYKNMRESEGWLQKNSNVYVNGACVQPPRGKAPKFSCRSSSEARNAALTVCAISYKGCDAALAAFKNDLDGADKKFLASQICEATLADYLGESRGAGAMALDLVIAVSENGCEDGGFWGSLGCLGAIAGKTIKFGQFIDCVQTKSALCLSNYDEWQNGPERKKSMCLRNVRVAAEEKRNVASLSSQIAEKKDTWMYRWFVE